jgi:hypothetical protein
MASMFEKKKPDKTAIQNLKNLITDNFKLDKDSIISIAELSCHEPDCPPIETVVTIHHVDGNTKNFKIHKPMNKIQPNDLIKLIL